MREQFFVPGAGSYKAFWKEGKVSVAIIIPFADGLEYEKKDWKYCTLDDSSFYTEIQDGLKPPLISIDEIIRTETRCLRRGQQ